MEEGLRVGNKVAGLGEDGGAGPGGPLRLGSAADAPTAQQAHMHTPLAVVHCRPAGHRWPAPADRRMRC
eukprot:1138415-Pelagomonas_calceolata.AAC.3